MLLSTELNQNNDNDTYNFKTSYNVDVLRVACVLICILNYSSLKISTSVPAVYTTATVLPHVQTHRDPSVARATILLY